MPSESKTRISCTCGKSYLVPMETVGKTVKCPGCNREFVCAIEQEKSNDTKACAACGEQISVDKIICPHCDYNHRTKKKVKRTDPLELAERSKAKVRKREDRQAKAEQKPKVKKKKEDVRWGVDTVALSSGAGMLLLGLAITAVGLLAGRIMIWGLVLLIIGVFGVLKGLVGEQGIW